MALLANRFFIALVVIYGVSLTTLAVTGIFSLIEPLIILVIFGVILPGLAWWLTRSCEQLPVHTAIKPAEIPVTFALIVLIILYLLWGGEFIDSLVYRVVEKTPRLTYLFGIVKKLVVFVIVPYAVFSLGFGYRWRDFGFTGNLRAAFSPPFLILLAAFFAFYFALQYTMGKAAQPIFHGELSPASIIIGGFMLYLLLIVEVGLVEEFFFRAVVQTRMTAWLGSEIAGIVMMALIFGLAHAPGLYLRQAGALTELGETPAMLSVIAYAIVVLSTASLAFGVIWARTRNIYILILIHAWVDTLPGLPGFVRTFAGS